MIDSTDVEPAGDSEDYFEEDYIINSCVIILNLNVVYMNKKSKKEYPCSIRKRLCYENLA